MAFESTKGSPLRRKGLLVGGAIWPLVLLTGCYDGLSAGAQEAVAADGGSLSAKCTDPEEKDALVDQVVQLVNLVRASKGLAPVTHNPNLSSIADGYACHMIEKSFFAHYDPATGHGPSDRALLGKYAFLEIGENLAAGQENASEVVDVWMKSDAHRAIILDPKWDEIGVGVQFGGEYGVYWVQEFGRTPSTD